MIRHRGWAEVSVRCLCEDEVGLVNDERLKRLLVRFRLSPRETSVVDLLLKGKQTKEIATQLELSPRTAKFHASNLLRKLGAANRFQLLGILLGLSRGWHPPPLRGR